MSGFETSFNNTPEEQVTSEVVSNSGENLESRLSPEQKETIKELKEIVNPLYDFVQTSDDSNEAYEVKSKISDFCLSLDGDYDVLNYRVWKEVILRQDIPENTDLLFDIPEQGDESNLGGKGRIQQFIEGDLLLSLKEILEKRRLQHAAEEEEKAA
jgi:hypothetical protein